MKTTRKYPALGILFKGEMVRAIQAGRKTQTRRIVKPQPIDDTVNSGYVFSGDHNNLYKNDVLHQPWQERFVELAPIKAGEVLYVKETWQPFDGTFSRYVFRADAREVPGVRGLWWRNENGVDLPCEPKWKSSLFMPYEAARIFLKVTGIRVERLNDISRQDAISEGIEQKNGHWIDYHDKDRLTVFMDTSNVRFPGESTFYPAEAASYRTLWETINGAKSWLDNPCVWAYTFEITDKPA